MGVFIPKWFKMFRLCLVSSAAIRSAELKISTALGERSFRFPMGVPHKYNVPAIDFSSLFIVKPEDLLCVGLVLIVYYEGFGNLDSRVSAFFALD